MGSNKFSTLLKSSIKSKDTEEWIDTYFTRPVGLVFTLLFNSLGIHPTVITIVSIFFGIGAAYMFHFPDLEYNIYGIILLVSANICDSIDGQMARLSGKKTLLGRVLDGFAGDVWFFSIYVAFCIRLQNDFIPFTTIKWGIIIWALAIVSGVLFHSPQASLADYYRQIHLLFLKGKEGSELDNYTQQRAIFESLKSDEWFKRIYYYNYAKYCRSQEKRTPLFQQFYKKILTLYGSVENLTVELKEEFLKASRPLMKYTNILSFNIRAIVLYITCLLNVPYLYFIFEMIVLGCIYIYLHYKHEGICKRLVHKL